MKTTIAEQCNLTEEGIRETIFGKPGEKDAENQVALNAALEKYSLPGITLKQILNALDSDAPVSGWTFMRTVLQHPNLSRLYHRINPLSSTVVEALLPKTRATLNSKKVITEDPDSGIFFTDQVVPALDSILQENTELSQVFACLKTSSHFLEVVEKIRAWLTPISAESLVAAKNRRDEVLEIIRATNHLAHKNAA